jgi:c-di-AMP phosphodiesterase-like protein
MIYDDIALSSWSRIPKASPKELFAQAVDEMMAIAEVKAAFGIIELDGEIHISARSNGEVKFN